MERSGEEGSESSRIDVNTLPDSLVRLWDTMLRIDPTWDLAAWLEERADDELELVEAHLGRERLRLEQRLHRIETLVKKLKRQREVAGPELLRDPHQKNLFDIFDKSITSQKSEEPSEENDEPLVSGGIMGVDDDPLLAIVAEHILGTIEVASLEDDSPVHFDDFIDALQPMGISVDEVDEAIAYLLQHRQIIEIEQDFFGFTPKKPPRVRLIATVPFKVETHVGERVGAMVSDASGWYARLDRSCENRIEQLERWLDAWEESIRHNIPIAATMPNDWPTLPAGLLSNPGAVLDHMLARYDAEIDGRSPRGAYATPARFADAMLADELGERGADGEQPVPTGISLAALPPGFRAFAAQMNEANSKDDGDEVDEAVTAGKKTASGIPLPFADPAVGAGLFPERLLKVHSERIDGLPAATKKEDTIRLLSKLQLLDISDIAVRCTRRRLLLVLAKSELIELDGEGDESRIGRKQAEELLETSVQEGDALRGSWPWDENPRLLICNPPWLRIKDRFRGHPDGSHLRKELSRELRSITEPDGRLRFSTLLGNVNLYRLFLERSLQLVEEGGRVRMIVPDSLLREKSSIPLRRLMVERNNWDSAWSFPESQRVFPGVSQGVLVIAISVGGETTKLTSWGPLESTDVLPSAGLDPKSPKLELERSTWATWTDTNWAVPRMPRKEHERRKVLNAISQLADLPRLSEDHNWLNPSGDPIRVRVGEIDQTTWSEDIRDWKPRSRGTPFIRGIHFSLEKGKVSINHPGYTSSIPRDALERSQAMWKGPIDARGISRIACQAIVNAQQDRRLRWVVVPPDCVLGNSVNFLELPEAVQDSLAEEYGTLEQGLLWLAEHLNSDTLDLWSRAWAANNNVNNYEIENLPFPPPVSVTQVELR